jgi:1-deoxy-D-xylulose-5-phosphate synthase
MATFGKLLPMMSAVHVLPSEHADRKASAVAEALSAAGIVKPLLQLGLPDKFIDHGDATQLLAQCGLDAAGITASVNQRLNTPELRLVANSR